MVVISGFQLNVLGLYVSIMQKISLKNVKSIHLQTGGNKGYEENKNISGYISNQLS